MKYHTLVPLIFALAVSPLGAQAPAIVGDGKADDTAAVQKAVDAGGAVRFARGTYRLTRTVVIDLDQTGFISLSGDGVARFVMEGAGPAFHFKGTHGGTADPKSLKPEIFERQRTPMVDGIEIVGAHAEADGIEATGTMQVTITRLAVHEARHGIHLTVRNRNVIISDCHLYHNTGIGVFYDQVDLHQSNIIGSHISYNAGGGVVTRGGGVRNLHIGTCDIESNMTPEAPPTANVLIDCTGGSTAEVAIVGCTIQHNPSPGAANVRFIGKSKPEDDTQWGHLSITDNVLSDVEVNIDLQHVRGAVITGNTFGGGFEHDLRVTNCSNIAVGSNSFDRNPPYYRGKRDVAKGGLVFRHCRDITLTGMHIDGVRTHPAAVEIEDGDTFNISGCTILDSDGVGLLLKKVSNSLISGCLIADRRPDRAPAPSIRIEGGQDNTFANNKLAHDSATAPAPTK
ncbi:right-handed parallel beta-helix repeat-containing protein [Prosthecobacter sp.]|uniref:right-handed parallel beta-helix repeat-containing protein n=1 Tax=Prosthecobacter sp. TaxID=1965333 RepID=UPI0024883623|nr:right-handed parallel beta-helix repeat-containing protein [Prosthecobacter sp.]MDI1314534.1 right-handed parallel beta-helix repeat-containing protein [Prosthecobacter sp.]